MKVTVTKNWLVEAYIKKGQSQDTIAKKLNTSRRQVRNLLAKYGIKKDSERATKTTQKTITAKTTTKPTTKAKDYTWEEVRRMGLRQDHLNGLISPKMLANLMNIDMAIDYAAHILRVPLKAMKQLLETHGIISKNK